MVKALFEELSLVSCGKVKANSSITNASVSAASHPSQRERAFIDGVNIISIVMNFLPTTVTVMLCSVLDVSYPPLDSCMLLDPLRMFLIGHCRFLQRQKSEN
jgi:hypothetical protein